MSFRFDDAIRQSVVYPLVELLRVLNTSDSTESEVGQGRADWSRGVDGPYGDVWEALAKVVFAETGWKLGALDINYGGGSSWLLDLEDAIQRAMVDAEQVAADKRLESLRSLGLRCILTGVDGARVSIETEEDPSEFSLIGSGWSIRAAVPQESGVWAVVVYWKGE